MDKGRENERAWLTRGWEFFGHAGMYHNGDDLCSSPNPATTCFCLFCFCRSLIEQQHRSFSCASTVHNQPLLERSLGDTVSLGGHCLCWGCDLMVFVLCILTNSWWISTVTGSCRVAPVLPALSDPGAGLFNCLPVFSFYRIIYCGAFSHSFH